MHLKVYSFFAAALLVGSVFVACSSSNDAAAAAADGNCPAVGSKVCPNENAITQSDNDACNKQKADATCGGKYVDELKCEGTNVSCGSDGKLDTAKITNACSSQIGTYTSCAINNITLDAGGGG